MQLPRKRLENPPKPVVIRNAKELAKWLRGRGDELAKVVPFSRGEK